MIEGHSLTVDLVEQTETPFETIHRQPLREREEGRLEFPICRVVRPILMIETVFGIGSVRTVIEGGGFDEPGITSRSHDSSKLAGDDSTG